MGLCKLFVIFGAAQLPANVRFGVGQPWPRLSGGDTPQPFNLAQAEAGRR